MKDNRRDFLKFSVLTGIAVTAGLRKGLAMEPIQDQISGEPLGHAREQHFNMSGYAAPKLDTIRVGFIGLGMRGPTHLKNLTKLEGVEIKALCDLRPEKLNHVQKLLEGVRP